MGTNECSQPASKSSWDSQDFDDVNMVLKMVHFHKSSRPQWVNYVLSMEHAAGMKESGRIQKVMVVFFTQRFLYVHVRKGRYWSGACRPVVTDEASVI